MSVFPLLLHHSEDNFSNAVEQLLHSLGTPDEKTIDAVRDIVETVRTKGDCALCRYIKKFDGLALSPESLRISPGQIRRQASHAPSDLAGALKDAAVRIRKFHEKQRPREFSIKTAEGRLTQLIRPVESAGVYSPGGTTGYPSSILMCAIPAQIAGVKRIVAAVPSRETLDPGVACALLECNIDEVYRIGGAHAIAALAYGTETIPAVKKIVGPGNKYVALAKKHVFGTADIDTIAGPSEVAILADNSANPRWIALDMLAQAEHGSGDEKALLVTESASLARTVQRLCKEEIERSPKKETFTRLSTHALTCIVCASRKKSLAMVNRFAPEHLQIMTAAPEKDLNGVTNAGAIFLGAETPVALGDYYIGTNHVLPTARAAAFSSALGTYSFLKHIPVARASKKGIAAACAPVATIAKSEGFVHHAFSAQARTGEYPADT